MIDAHELANATSITAYPVIATRGATTVIPMQTGESTHALVLQPSVRR